MSEKKKQKLCNTKVSEHDSILIQSFYTSKQLLGLSMDEMDIIL